MNRLRKGGLLTAAFLASSLLVGGPSHAGSASSVEAPLAFAGAVSPVTSLNLADITVLVEPRAEVVGAMQPGDKMEMHVLPKEVVQVDGDRYTVAVDPAAIPAENIADDGLVTFRIDILAAGGDLFGSAITSVRTHTPSGSDQAQWVDPLEYLGESDGSKVDSAPGASDSLEGVAPESPTGSETAGLTPDDESTEPETAPVNGLPTDVNVAMADATGYLNESGACEEGECSPENLADVPQTPNLSFHVGGNPYCTLLRTSDRWSTVGTSYPVGGHTSWLTHTSSTSSSMGTAMSSDNKYGSFSENGMKSTTNSWGQNFPAQSYDRSYRIETRYGNYKCTSYWTIYGWEPMRQNGYTWSYRLDSKPNWNTYCGPIAAGEWWRGEERGKDYSLSYGVKIAGLIGVDLTTRRSYSSGSRLYYDAPVRRRLCGNNDDAGVASKLRERFA